MKSLLVLWLAVELAVAAWLSSAACILRQDERTAYLQWRDQPTAETRAELDRQRGITRWHQVGLAGLLFAGMAGVTVPAMIFWSRRGMPGEKPGVPR
jgi:hypothetical protein